MHYTDIEYMTSIRRELHMCPGIGYDIGEALNIVRRELNSMNIKFREDMGKSSIVAMINEKSGGKTIAIRADMDALPINEENDVAYRSRNEGRMHACGHDAHTAVLLGTAKALSAMEDKLCCSVKLIFQASEESAPYGAPKLVNDGVMEDVDCIISSHVDAFIDVGKVAVDPGVICAETHSFKLELFGKSAHAAFPQNAVDATAMGVRIYSAIQLIITREMDPFENCILSIGSFNSGTAANIISDKCVINGTVRTFSSTAADKILKRIESIADSVCRDAGGSFSIEFREYLPAVNNDEDLSRRLRASAVKVLGEKKVLTSSPQMIGEDFAHYQKKRPGVMMRLGVRNAEKGFVEPLHNARFDLDEAALTVGGDIFTQFVLDNMNS